ncbi:MAG TPA: TonB-dependent receptor [Vicinamibacteria bacterium]|nr:TonB-dependent receptor [Vicinamibacteria bacterium]
MRVSVQAVLVSMTLSLPGAASAAAQTAPAPTRGTITGRVVHGTEGPAADADVEVLELHRRVRVAADGTFRFEDVPAGQYLVQAQSPRHGLSVASVGVVAGEETHVELDVDLARHHETVVVTARGEASALSEIAQPVTVLTGAELSLRLEPTLGETLAHQPGVSSTYFGPGASRPVIRGFGGDRIRILQDGVGTNDASNTSPDHAVAYDPLSAKRIEVVRGPATLLYGGNAVGGVVNVLDSRIPVTPATRALGGVFELAGGTVADEKQGAVSLGGGRGRFAWHADGYARDAGDLSIPGLAESAALRAEEGEEGEEHEQAEGVLPNSATEALGGALGGSFVGARGFIGLALSGYDTQYGVPGHHHEEGEHEEGEEGEEEEEAVRIDMLQKRGDLRAELHDPLRGLSSLRLRVGVSDYAHKELEGGAIGTTFSNDAWEGRLEASHRALGPLTGSFGLQVGRRDFEAVGEEAFLPPTVTRNWALFAFEEIGRGAVRFQLGGRYESQDVEASGDEPARRSSDGLSGSAGVVWRGGDGFSVGATVARSIKLPSAEELFSNGPHIATQSFEKGDPRLTNEKSLGLDLTLRRTGERVVGEASLFSNRFEDFIFADVTDDEEDGLGVVRYVQRDARFWGAEASLHVDLLHREPHHLDLELMGDFVRAELRDTGEPLPRIPPSRLGAGLHYHAEHWDGRVEVRHAADQDRVSRFESPTAGYTLLNASVGYRLFAGGTILDFILRGTNLADEEARVHTSFLKDLAPLPGRDVRLVVRVTF